MNREQKRYAEAKARSETLSKIQVENEKKFIQNSGYANPDGTVPTALWLIDDEEQFTRLYEEFEKSPLNIIQEVREAEKAREKAEDELIDYALSIIPAGLRETLEKGRKVWNIRQKLLDIAFRLDTKTVPKGVRG